MTFYEMRARLKECLLPIGKWGDFVAERTRLKMEGVRGYERKALETVAPEFVDEIYPRKGKASTGSKRNGGKGLSGVGNPEDKAAYDANRSCSFGKYGEEIGSANATKAVKAAEVPKADDSSVDMSAFDGKTCSMTEAIQWAYEHCGICGVSPEQAPSSLAWCLMNDFRRSPAYRFDLFKGIAIAKAKKEEAQEEFGGGNFDGKAEYDILARLGGSEARAAEEASE